MAENNPFVAAPASEQKQPTYPQFSSAADIDAYLMQQMERDAERDRAEQERRLNRQRIAQSMGDLGNILIDTIKASGGALVTPRDVTARYNQMDERSQQIYNNYRARMDLKNKYLAERAQQMRAREQQLADKADDRAWQEKMTGQNQAWQAEQARLGREASNAQHEATLKNQRDIAYHHDATTKSINDAKQENKDIRRITLGGNSFEYNKANERLVYGAMLYWLTQNGKVKKEQYQKEPDIMGEAKNPKMSDVFTLVATTIPSLTPEEQAKLYWFLENYNGKDGQAIIPIDEDKADDSKAPWLS